MIRIITNKNKNENIQALEDMFKLRYDVAVTQWGWNIPGGKKGYDKDQFDREDTVYFLAYNDAEEMVGCGRLNPTLKPHLLSEIFADQCETHGVPRHKNIWEFSRFMVDGRNQTHTQQVQTNLELCLAVTEYSVAHKIEKLSWLAYASMYTKSVVLWKTEALGAVKYYEDDDASYRAALIETTPESVKRIQRFLNRKRRKPIVSIQHGEVTHDIIA
ncbi:MAG: hypothetical protein COA43_12655 [Robiginitomaculum sp.]|nr:MAG: hypothetical protein COA43_12655 [Robiginitomaculum sp.]